MPVWNGQRKSIKYWTELLEMALVEKKRRLLINHASWYALIYLRLSSASSNASTIN